MDQVIRFVNRGNGLGYITSTSGTAPLNPETVELDLNGLKVTGYVQNDLQQIPSRTIIVYEDIFIKALFMERMNKQNKESEKA